jgi:hypothetical protein
VTLTLNDLPPDFTEIEQEVGDELQVANQFAFQRLGASLSGVEMELITGIVTIVTVTDQAELDEVLRTRQIIIHRDALGTDLPPATGET